MAWDGRLLQFIDQWIAPRLPKIVLYDLTSGPIVGVSKCSALPIISRTHDLKYDDELNCLPAAREFWTTVMTAMGFVAFFLAAIYGLAIQADKSGAVVKLAQVVSSGVYPHHEDRVMRNFEHIPVLGAPMSFLIAVYWPATEGWNEPFRLLTFYLTISEFALFSTWTVESWRMRNRLGIIGG